MESFQKNNSGFYNEIDLMIQWFGYIIFHLAKGVESS